MPENPIEYGIRQPGSDFEKRASEVNDTHSPSYPGKLGKGSTGGNYATQSKKMGMGDRQQKGK